MKRLAVLAAVLAASAHLPIADAEESAVDRAHAAIATTKRDLDEARVEAEAARAEAARITSASEARRVAAASRADTARTTRRALAAREAVLRAENDRLSADLESSESDLASVRDALRRAALDAAQAGSQESRNRWIALAKALDDANADFGPNAALILATLGTDARRARTPVLTNESVTVDGVGFVKGRVLRAGSGTWFLGADGVEAIRRTPKAGEPESFTPLPGEGIAQAFAAIDRGERSVTLPFDVTGHYAPSASLPARVAGLIREGGVVMLPLALLSAVAIWVLVDRLLARRRTLARLSELLASIKRSVKLDDREGATKLAAAGGPVGRALLLGLASTAIEARLTAAEAARSAALIELRARLWLLGTVAASAPFVGLFGTVVGIVRSFRDMARTGSSGFAVVASGISEALVATAAGIVVAVFAVIAYNALQAAAAAAAERVRREAEEALERGA